MIDHAKLHPHRFGADRDRLIDDLAGVLGLAEDVDDVDRLADLGQLAPDKFAVDMLAGDLRIDRDDSIAVVLEIFHYAVGGPVGAVRGADHSDRLRVREQVGDILVAGQRHRSSPFAQVPMLERG